MRRLFVRALTFNPSARRYLLKHPAGSLYRDPSSCGRASVSLRCHIFAAALFYIATRTCNTHPRACARASPRCEDAAGDADASPAHGPILPPRHKRAAEGKEVKKHSRDAVYRTSTHRKTASYPLNVKIHIPARRGYMLQPDSNRRTLCLRWPIIRQRTCPRTLDFQRDLQTHMSSQKDSTAKAAGDRIENSVETACTSLERLLRVSAGTSQDDVREFRSWARWRHCTLGARSEILRGQR